jgi:hypothetical protein
MNKTPITSGKCQSLSIADVDKMFFTTRTRGEKAIDTYCVECPAMFECAKIPASVEKPFGVFGGRWFS